MFDSTFKSRLTFLAASIVGIVGALGQAYLLHHELVNCYPYKMMSFPSAGFYAGIAAFGVYFSPILAIFCGLLSGLKRFWLATIVPVVLCPLLFAGVFKTASLMREWSGVTDIGRNFDDTKAVLVAQEFFSYTVSLAIAGLIIGGILGFLLLFVTRTKKLA